MIPKSLCRSFSLFLVSNVYFEQSLLFNEVRLLHESEKKNQRKWWLVRRVEPWEWDRSQSISSVLHQVMRLFIDYIPQSPAYMLGLPQLKFSYCDKERRSIQLVWKITIRKRYGKKDIEKIEHRTSAASQRSKQDLVLIMNTLLFINQEVFVSCY